MRILTWILIRSRWPRGLRRGSLAARLLGLRDRMSAEAWMPVCCECYQVEFSAMGRSLIQGIPTECDVSERGNQTSRGLWNHEKIVDYLY